MDNDTIAPAFEAGLATLRNAGVSGILRWDADDLADALLDDAWDASGLSDPNLNDASRQWWAIGAHETLMASYEAGLRERARCAIDLEIPYFKEEPGSSNLEQMSEAEEWAAYRATLIFEDLPANTSRADFIGLLRSSFPMLGPRYAERIVDGVIARRSERPIPQFVPDANGYIHTACPLVVSEESANLRRLAISMYLEKRATRPKHDPIPVKPDPSNAAPEPNFELPLSVEERRAVMGLPSGLLRTVDYDPAAIHTAPTWLVKGLFPDRGLGMLVGESQSGKSFLTVHAAICIARGEPFFGRKVKPGGVLYVAAEGGSSVLPRFKAADEAIGGMLADNHVLRKGKEPLARAPIKVMTETPNLSRDGDPAALARTIRAIAHECEESGFPLSLVVLDTLHASMCGGDEQSAADAGHALKPLREAAEELGLFVLIVHHPGKDIERGARGSSALRAAVDTEIELRVPGAEGAKAKPAGLIRRATLTKQRDGEVGGTIHYHLNTVQLGQDEDGEPWVTCTVTPCEAPALDAAGKPKGKHAARLHRALGGALAEHGGQRAPMSMVRGYFNNAGPADEKEETRRKAFRRTFEGLCDAGLIETDSCEQWVWFSKSARDAGHPDTP